MRSPRMITNVAMSQALRIPMTRNVTFETASDMCSIRPRSACETPENTYGCFLCSARRRNLLNPVHPSVSFIACDRAVRIRAPAYQQQCFRGTGAMKFNLIATVFAAAFLFVVSGGNAGAFTVTCPTIVKLNGTRYLPVVGVNDQGFGQAALGSDNGITCRYAVSYRPVTPPTGTPPACPPLKVTATFSGGSNATWTPGVPTFTETGSLQTARSPNGAVHTTCQYAGIASGRGLSASPTEALAPNNTVSVTTSV